MASCSFPFPTTINRHHRHAPPSNYNYAATTTTSPISICFSSSSSSFLINLHRSFPYKRNSWSGRCGATNPQSEPPSKENSPPSSDIILVRILSDCIYVSGVTSTFARFKDTLQIFFAVLFWMSLFFWSSAWDGGNSSGKRDKGSRFRK
ncbi:hypothetical protein BUALT_Bualt02G0108700 [Buddleja alternifolia]|uniref:Uncharacterized protein n=1 Tax=Buddleja alternifolia TaxID=168488 RepID=A0AAV6YAB3_9LAMI|nr:hypothetical protein BUALT_Bualt02G0108700 [Buddleja alternifolia]